MNAERVIASAAVAALGVLAFLLAEGLGAGPGESTGRAPASRPASKPATGPSTATAPTGVLLEWHRTGGFAGTNDTLAVQADGSYKTAGKLAGAHQGRLDANMLAGLAEALQAAKITADAEYRSDGRMADGFHYVFRAGGHTVKWEDGAKAPATIEALAKRVAEVLEQARTAKSPK